MRKVVRIDMPGIEIEGASLSLYHIEEVYEPYGEALIKISTYLGVSTDYLLGTKPEKRERPPFRLDLFGSPDESENIELLQDINNQVKDNPTNADDEMDTLILEIYKRLPEKKRKEALLTLLDLLKK
jgi:hypothetical protein